MTDEQFAELLKRLDQLTGKLGGGTDGLWTATLAQAHIEGIVAIAFYVLILALGYVVWMAWGWYKRSPDNYCKADRLFGVAMVTGLYVALVSAALATLPLTIAAFTNPNYWAIRHLFSQLKR